MLTHVHELEYNNGGRWYIKGYGAETFCKLNTSDGVEYLCPNDASSHGTPHHLLQPALKWKIKFYVTSHHPILFG